MEREQKNFVLIIIGIFIFGLIYLASSRIFGSRSEVHVYEAKTQMSDKIQPEANSIIVHISGAVEKPGVYRLKDNSRIIDLLRISRVLENADLDKLNLAQKLNDGEKIFVQEKYISNQRLQNNEFIVDQDFKDQPLSVNINSASLEELLKIKGIGKTMAKRIIEHRDKNGPFRSVEDLKKVKGIGEKKFEKIKNQISVF